MIRLRPGDLISCTPGASWKQLGAVSARYLRVFAGGGSQVFRTRVIKLWRTTRWEVFHAMGRIG
jgi:hypothetical protein